MRHHEGNPRADIYTMDTVRMAAMQEPIRLQDKRRTYRACARNQSHAQMMLDAVRAQKPLLVAIVLLLALNAVLLSVMLWHVW